MDLTPYISNLREDLAATASTGDDQTRRAAALLSGALEPAVRLALMNALADFAAETTANLPDHVVEVRLDGRDGRAPVARVLNDDHRDAIRESEAGDGEDGAWDTAGSTAAGLGPSMRRLCSIAVHWS